MRKTLAFMLGLTLAVGIALGMIGTQVLNAQYAQQQEPIKRTVLLKTDLQGYEGQEGYLVMVDIAPGTRVPKHYHPGPVFAYVLSGGGTWQAVGDGTPPKTLKEGSGLYIEPKQVHEEVAGPSGEKVIAVFIAPKGMPLTIPVK